MHDVSTTTRCLQATMPAAAYEPSPAVPTQKVHPMDLLASSGSSVPAAAARKAVGTWAAPRQFGISIDGRFCMFWGTVASGDQIRRCRCRECAPMCVVVEGTRGGRERRERGRRKSVQTHCHIRVTGLTPKKVCASVEAK